MFFVISGYLITSNADRRWSGLANVRPTAFYALRLARIIPCLLLLLAVVDLLTLSGVALFQNHTHDGVSIPFWLVNLASLTFWMNVLIGREGWFNYPLGVQWSLSIEEVFYLSLPIVCLLLRRDGRLLAFGPWSSRSARCIAWLIRETKVAISTPTTPASTGSPLAAAPRCSPSG